MASRCAVFHVFIGEGRPTNPIAPPHLLGPVRNRAISAGDSRGQGASRAPIGGDAVGTLYQLLKIVLAGRPSLMHNSESANGSYSGWRRRANTLRALRESIEPTSEMPRHLPAFVAISGAPVFALASLLPLRLTALEGAFL
jgi:hypothetical protein